MATETKPEYTDVRDQVGDLNRSAILAGDFPGSFQLPGKDISLAIGGFIKTVAIADSDAESAGANFLPAYLEKNNDEEGSFSIDPTLSRIYLDGRAPARMGTLNGYVEWDFNNGNDGEVDVKMRHVSGGWKYENFSLVAGHTWSTLMDLKIIPEGLTEPTVSGVIFMRQPQIRVSQAFESGWRYTPPLKIRTVMMSLIRAATRRRTSRTSRISLLALSTAKKMSGTCA